MDGGVDGEVEELVVDGLFATGEFEEVVELGDDGGGEGLGGGGQGEQELCLSE